MPKNPVLKHFFKIVALLTAVCLGVPTPAGFAIPAFSAGVKSVPAIQLNHALSIPESLGTLDEFKPGRSDKTFILIQDAHQSLEAQLRIADLIELFVKQNSVKTVFEEGYEGVVPTDELMKTVADPAVKRRVSYYLMDQLLIGGAEYAHINRGTWSVESEASKTNSAPRDVAVSSPPLYGDKDRDVHSTDRVMSSPHVSSGDLEDGSPTKDFGDAGKRGDFKLIGADKLREHFDSVAWYGKASEVQKSIDRDLSAASQELERLIPQFVSRPMRHLIKAKNAYEIQKIDFVTYLREVAGTAIETQGGMMFSVDYPGLASAVRALDSKQAKAIEDVRKLAARDLWRELEQLENDLQKRFLKTETEKAIIVFYRKIEALKRLNKIALTSLEYEGMKAVFSELNTQKLADFIARHGKRTVVLSREWEEQIRYALEFYDTAIERDRAVKEAAEAFIKNPDEQTAVLVYGGFHTSRIRETLQALGVTYAVVSPRMTRLDKIHADRYRELMAASGRGIKEDRLSPLARPLSAIELHTHGNPEERSRAASKILTLDKIMRGLPETLSLSQAVREAALKLKTPSAVILTAAQKASSVRSEVRSTDEPQPEPFITAEQKRKSIVRKIRRLNQMFYDSHVPSMDPLIVKDAAAVRQTKSVNHPEGDVRSMYLYYALRRAVMGEPSEDEKEAAWDVFVPLLLEIATLFPELDPPVALSGLSLKLSSHPEINQVRIRLIKRLRMASMGEEQHESRGSRLHPVLVSLLMIALNMGIPEARAEVIRTLPELRSIPKSERNAYLLLSAAMYGDERTPIEIKEAVLEALGRYGARYTDLREFLLGRVKAIYLSEEANPRLQVAALKALALMGDFSQIEALIYQQDPDLHRDLIIEFIRTLGSVKTAAAFNFLDSLVGSVEDDQLIAEVFAALRGQGTAAAYHLLQQKAFHENQRLRNAALLSLESVSAREAAAIAAAHLNTLSEGDPVLGDEDVVGEDLIAMMDYLRLKQEAVSLDPRNELPVIVNIFHQLKKFSDYQLVFNAAPDLFTLLFTYQNHAVEEVSKAVEPVSNQVTAWIDSASGKRLVNAGIAIGYLSSRTGRDLNPAQIELAVEALNTLASFEDALALLTLSPEIIWTLTIYYDHPSPAVQSAAQNAFMRVIDDLQRDLAPPEEDTPDDEGASAKSEVRSEMRTQEDGLNSIPRVIAEEAAKRAILQAVRREEAGIAARIVTALPHLFSAQAATGENLTASQVLERLNGDPKYAIRLERKDKGWLFSLVEDDGFDIGIEGQPKTWIDIDKPLWTERVSEKHFWFPLVQALTADLRSDQQRALNQSPEGYGPRLAQLYASARSEQRQVDRTSASADSSESARSEVRTLSLEQAYELHDAILGIDDDEEDAAAGAETDRAIKLKVEKFMRMLRAYEEVRQVLQTEGFGGDGFWEGLFQWSLIDANRDLIAARLAEEREADAGLREVWPRLLQSHGFEPKNAQEAIDRMSLERLKQDSSAEERVLKKFVPDIIPKRDAFLYGVWKFNPREVDSLAGIDLEVLMARFNALQALLEEESRGAFALRLSGFAELLKLPLTANRYKRIRAAAALGRAQEQLALEMKAAGLETPSVFIQPRKTLYGYQLWKNAALELAAEKPGKPFSTERPENYWQITQSFRNWLTQKGAMPETMMMQMIHAYTYETNGQTRKTGAVTFLELKGAEFSQRANLVIDSRFWRNSAGKKRAIWIQAAGVSPDGRKIITLHLRPNGRPLGAAYWNEQAQEFESHEGPVFSTVNAKQIHRQWLAWAEDSYEMSSLEARFKVRGTEKNSFAVRIFPGGTQSALHNVRFRGGETIRVTAEAFGEERRFTAHLPEIPAAPKRKEEFQYRYYQGEEGQERLLTPAQELSRRLESSWAQGAPAPIGVRVDRAGELLMGRFESIRIPSSKNKRVYVVFERAVKDGKTVQRVLIYGQQPGARKNSEINTLLWQGRISAYGNRLVSDVKNFEPKRLLGKERYQLQAWLSWNLGYTAAPASGPGLNQAETAYLIAGMLREKALTLKQLQEQFKAKSYPTSSVEAVLKKMKDEHGFSGYRITEVGSGRYGFLLPLIVGKGNKLHPFRSHYRFSHPQDLEGVPVDAVFDDKKLLQIHVKETGQLILMKHQWDFEGNLLWSGASHPPAQFTSFTFSSYEVPRTEKTSVSTEAQRFRIPGKAGEIIAGVLIDGKLRRVDWFAPGTHLHNVYKITPQKTGGHKIEWDEDLQVRPLRFLESDGESLPLEVMTRVVFEGPRSEVRSLKGDFFPDERASYESWETAFERDRQFQGAVLQAAVERDVLRVSELVKKFRLSRSKVKKALRRYGFSFSQTAQQNRRGYVFLVPEDIQTRLDETNPLLSQERTDFVRYDLLGAISDLVARENVYLPEGTVDEVRYKEKNNFVFWKAVAPGLATLFQPITGNKTKIRGSVLRTWVMELWAAKQVLQSLQTFPLNGYQEPAGAALQSAVFAEGLSKAALSASEKKLFTEKDLPRLRQLQLDLERLHFQGAKILIEFERSLESNRSEMRKTAVREETASVFKSFARPEDNHKAAMIDFKDLLTFNPEEVREAAIVMKQRSQVQFVIYNADPTRAQLLSFKRLLGFRNVEWTRSRAEAAFQALGPQFKEGGVVGFSRGGQDSGGGFSAASLKKIRRFKLSPQKPGTLAAALSFDPDDPRYRWGILREGNFYIVSDAMASIAADFLNHFVFAASA